MAQIREFESTTESYFILDGVSYPKVYEAMLDNGYSDTKIKLVGTNRDTTPLVFSTQYTNIRVDGDSFDTALEAISRLNQIVFSKGGGSGTGGATNVITEDSDTVAFTGNGTAGTPLKAEVKSDGLDYIPLTGTEEGKPVTGIIETAEDVKIGYKNGNSYSLVQFGEGYSQLSMGIEDLPTTGFDVMSANITASNLIGDDYYSGIKVQTEQKLDSVLTLGVGLFSMNDYSQIEPENKLIYAQRSYVDKAISNIDFSPKFSEIVIEAETDGIEIPITGGTYMVYNFRGQTVYRYMTTATNTNGYPIEDSFYATLTAGVLSNKITQRNQ